MESFIIKYDMVGRLFYWACFIVLSNLSAQNRVFVYEYKYKSDSLDRTKVDREIMLLNISEGFSKYFSYQKYIDDSIYNEELKKTEARLPSLRQKSKNQEVVIKNYTTGNKELYTTINEDYYKIEKNNNINWEILSNTKVISGYKVQQAITNFGGRKWIAWFTQEIPIQDGPYLFSGLPGLILDIEDTKKDHEMKLVSIRKETAFFNNFNEKFISVTENKFNQVWNIYKKDPIIKIRQLILNSPGTFTMYDIRGKEMDKDEILKFREKIEFDKIKHNNNFIDLLLYK